MEREPCVQGSLSFNKSLLQKKINFIGGKRFKSVGSDYELGYSKEGVNSKVNGVLRRIFLNLI